MRLPNIRIRVRTLMIAVAAVAMVLGVAHAIWQRSYCLTRLAEKRSELEFFRADVDKTRAYHAALIQRGQPVSPWLDKLLAYYANELERQETIVEIYRRGADRPWLPIPQEPPPTQ